MVVKTEGKCSVSEQIKAKQFFFVCPYSRETNDMILTAILFVVLFDVVVFCYDEEER